jgi:hypothetical protein
MPELLMRPELSAVIGAERRPGDGLAGARLRGAGGRGVRHRGSFLFSSLREHPRFKALLRKMNLANA